MTRLVQLTDTHIYDTPAGRFERLDTRASCAAVLAAAQRGEPYEGLVLSGDLAMDESTGAYRWLAEALAGERATIYALPGNHDDPARLAAAGFAAHLAPAVVECGAWQLVLLSSHVPGAAHGRLGEEQLAWLAGVLDAARDRSVAVFVHHHPLAIACPWMDAMGLEDAERFWNVVERFDSTRLVAFGHVHQNVDTYRAGVRVLGTPSTCIQFRPRALRYATDPRPPGYRTLHLRDDGSVDTRVVRVALEGQSTARRR